ncbi:ATP-binding protein [Noviherbaspirillum pedocola]|uniref:histidine kinase n=1 Tax=Noviherbaspirillum pedocola TaxID=2801341 RepID=A0A934STK1_9BURK|nr:ATP-binding protein [Noviherbaspirillum pedocola]MBK4736531.1 PAS domain-containing protein [Noviherbaspirillum pedocola]
MNAETGFDLFAGAGVMRERMRRQNWEATALGPPRQWPSSLRTAVGIMLNSSYPMFLAWGPGLSFLYNDAYISVMGRKDGDEVGRPFADIWADIWSDIEPLVRTAMSGEAIFADNLMLVMERYGYPEETYFTFSYSPIHDESGKVAGMFCACTETTQQVLSERRQRFRLQLADRMRELAEPRDIAATAAELLGKHLNLSRAAYAEVEDDGQMLRILADWTDGRAPALPEHLTIRDFGIETADALARGHALCFADVATDACTRPYLSTFQALHAGALLLVPLVKSGRLRSLLMLAHEKPGMWRRENVALSEDVAERIWLAMERGYAESRRRHAEAALARQLVAESDRLRQLFEQAPGFMAVMRGPRHVFELANRVFTRTVGQRELLGRPFAEALPELAEQGFVALLDQVYATGRPFSGQDALVSLKPSPDAPPEQHFMDFIYQPVLDADGSVTGIFIEGYDVTARRLADEAVRDSEERLREGMEVARMVVWDWDLGSNRISYSDNTMDVFGHEADEAPPQWGAIHPEDRLRIMAKVDEAIAARGAFDATLRMIRPDDGAVIWIEARGKVLCDANRQPIAIRGISLDITERKRAEDALRDADRRKDEFLAMLAHELRNPLAPISTAAHLLKLTQAKDPQLRRTSEIISRQVEHMTSLVDDLLDVSRVTRGLIRLQPQLLALPDIVAATVEQVRALIEERGHRLTLTLPPNLPPVMGDRTRLIQVFTNLLNNAAKYTPPGGEIGIHAQRDGDGAVLAVRDNGIGIEPNLLPHVFDLFTQAERSPDRAQGGLGLGLALVKSLVELHGGRVSVSSAGPGRGSEFTVRLPLAGDTVLPPAREEPEEEHVPRMRPHVLLVDDNMDAANTLAQLLELQGYTVSVEYDAGAALARTERETPQVCLLDIGLPDIDGYELARRLRALPATAGAVLIALTGYGQEQDRIRSQRAGFDYHLVKPVQLDNLNAILSRIGAPAPAAQH